MFVGGRRVVLVKKALPRPATDEELKNPGRNLYDRLQALSSRIRRLMPSSRDPEAFHVERSSIAHDLQKVADEIGRPSAGS